MASLTTYAAGECIAGFEEVSPGKCVGPVGKECTTEAGWPEGWTKAPNGSISGKNGVDTEDQTTCFKFKVAGSANPEDAGNIQMLLNLQQFLNQALWPVLVLIGGLMDNDLLFGEGMEERLNEIWIIIRNLVNILFVIVLVGIALYNILGLGEDGGNYAIKSVLPKIVIAIIAVNFSFTAIKILLDAVNILTVSVFALPDTVNEGLSQILPTDERKKKVYVEKLCQALSGFTVGEFNALSDQKIETIQGEELTKMVAKRFDDSIKETDLMDSVNQKIAALNPEKRALYDKELEDAKQGQMCYKKSGLTPQGELFLSRYNSRNAAFAMALNMAKITFYDQIAADSLASVEKLTINVLFSAVFYLIFAASFIALFIVLLARLVVMWLSIALSPLLILTFAEPTLKEKLGGFSKLSEQFTKMAIAPLIIALSMSIGWIMLKAIQGLSGFSQGSGLHVGNTLGIPIAGLSTLQDLTVALGTIAVVWMGVFAASEGTIAQGATDMIKGAVTKAGKWLGTLPLKHTPLTGISVPGAPGEKFNLGEFSYAAQQAFQDKAQPRMWNALTGQENITPETLNDPEKVKTKDDVYRYLKWAKESGKNLSDPAFLNALKTFKGAQPAKWESLDPRLKEQLNAVLDNPDEKDKKAASEKALKIVDSMPGITALKGTSLTKDDGSSKPTVPPAPGIGSETDDYNGQTPKQIISDPDKRALAMADYDDKVKALGGELGDLKGTHEKGTGIPPAKIGEIKATIVNNLKLDNKPPTEAALEKHLGKEKYEYLLLALSGDGKKDTGKNVLKQLLEQRPTPPAAPPAASGTPPAAPGGAPPAAPAAPPAPAP